MVRALPIPDLAHRMREAELMDAPSIDPERHGEALRALARVNALSLATERLWRAVRRHASTRAPVRLLDLACGGGDVAVAVARRAARVGMGIEVHGCDRSPFAISWARAQARRAGVQACFTELDVIASPLPTGYHVVTCSLFLHHLDEEEAVRLLKSMASAGLEGLVQDLRRSRSGYALAWTALHALTRSRIARVDGLRSVRAAFSAEELRTLAREADLPSPIVEAAWPQRLVLRWTSAAAGNWA
jgi:2-polyprenyl-3-methyl-5-hydroxy-6-metoxy-1,4-benzoquinol methylase